MAQTKTPFLSLASRGSVGPTLTTQRRGKFTVARTRPLPTGPRTLSQSYQRWLYEDYAYLWTQQSQATKASYRSAGVPYHLTAFQYWMKYQLTNLPDIVASWHLDNPGTPLQFDSGRLSNHITRFGASETDGVISRALHFDGINDRLRLVDNPSISPRLSLSIDFWYRVPISQNLGQWGALVWKSSAWILHTDPNDTRKIRLYLYTTPASWTGWYTLPDDDWHHILAGCDLSLGGNNIFLYDAGQLQSVGSGSPYIRDSASALIVAGGLPGRYINCDIDMLVLYNRLLTPTEALIHSERRYPL